VTVRDLRYAPYEGEVRPHTHAIGAIARNELSVIWSHLRTKLLFLFGLVIDVIYLVLVFIEAGFVHMMSEGEQPVAELTTAPLTAYVWIKLYCLILLYAATGCGAVSHDIRAELMQFYFAKPLKRLEYIMGKAAGLVLAGAVVTLAPALLLGGLRLALLARTGLVADALTQFGAVIAFELVMLATFAFVILALSSLTRRTGYAVLSWLGVIFVPDLMALIVGEVVDARWPHLISLTANLTGVFSVLVERTHEISVWAPPGVVAGVLAGAAAVVWWRIGVFERL
jgi:ABC-2 type transport system permease protein